MNFTIRTECEKDYRTVEELVREAFWDLYVPGCSEHFILYNLRKSTDFIPELDFIAEKAGRISFPNKEKVVPNHKKNSGF